MSHMARFSIIPGWIVTDPRLKGSDLKVLCLLGRHTDKHGWCRRSQVKMAAQLGCARSTVQASLDRLGELGVVEKHVEESADGRDSAHSYRVIYDAPPPAGYAFDAWEEAESEEENPISGLSEQTPPAGIPAPPAGPESAPPAGPESAPPAGPESAPINDPYLTTPSERKEREAREREFKRWFASWPTFVSDSQPDALKAWMALLPEDRARAVSMTEAYIAAVKASDRKYVCSAAKYLSERRWEKLPKPEEAPKPPQLANAYSRAWMGLHFAGLKAPMRRLSFTPLEERIIAMDESKRALLWDDKCRKGGWPQVTALHDKAREFKGVAVPGPIAQAAERLFDKVHVGGPVWEAWKRLHDRRHWPFPPPPDKLEFVQFPAIGADEPDLDQAVERAVTRFWADLTTAGATDDAA